MSFTLTIHTDNAAFYDEPSGAYAPHNELARILRDVAADVTVGVQPGQNRVIRDINGNDVGWFQLAKEDA